MIQLCIILLLHPAGCERRHVRYRENAVRCGNPSVADRHPSVVQRQRRGEDAGYKLSGENGVGDYAGIFVAAQRDSAFKCDECANSAF